MKQIHSLLCLLLLVVSFTACESNDDSNSNSQNDDTFAQNFGNAASKDFIGQVVDIDNHPIQNAEIKIGTSTVQTDINGVFIINGADVHEKFAYITATKAGYIDGSRAMVPTSGKNNVKIMLIPNAPIQTIQSGVESEVALPSGTKVNFDGEFQDENGNSYSGTVSVSMFHLLPSDDNIDKLMPGMLYAQTKTNQEAVLETFGMLNVELRGSAGQKLNIKEGHTAEITLKIDDSQTATAPGSIPLWHFDEAKGYWKEDGFATKLGNKYVGEVSHFSWWNCDIPNSSIRLTITILDINSNPLPNVRINILNPVGFHANGSTEDNGQLSGILPANQTLTLNVITDCGIIYTTTIGPFTSDTVLPTISITNSQAVSTRLNGTVKKCDGTNVTNGYVLMHYGTTDVIKAVTNGTFNFTNIVCSDNNQFTLEGVDFDNWQTTGNINFTFTPPITDVGQLTACTSSSEFITYRINEGETYLITSEISATSNVILSNGFNAQIYIRGGSNNSFDPLIFLGCTGTIPGSYVLPNSFLNARYISITPGIWTATLIYYNNLNPINELTITINSYGAVGEYIDFTFSGVSLYSGLLYHITGSGHVIRDN
ncbi:hypothetical protein L1S35_10805 [Flavobacterium sp. AS60]|uniref:hypothetical protein n=1 Tax=Flavobacterium anseongense TaxID=2910677 RepID=UPI001F4175C8|nr:hypothetical protein [Flavobacterium sp. AS60]MCF6130166.1 hypothetical protein [Flavobacterium sp. AS60]